MMPRSDENMKALADDLTSLVLEHKGLIARYEERLDGSGSLDTDDLMRSQIEFLVLNVRAAMVSKEQELRQVESEREFRRQMAEDPGPGQPVNIRPLDYPSAPARLLTGREWVDLVPWPPAPDDATDRAIFMHRARPGVIMPAFQLKSGAFILAVPDAGQTTWAPTLGPWYVDFSEPLRHAD